MSTRGPNDPGRPPLPVWAGRTQATVLARMLQRLATWQPAPADSSASTPFHGVGAPPSNPPQGTPSPLRGLVPLSPRNSATLGADLTYGLLDAWAAVADVLAFYQERITQEGYLLTATEDLSVQELVRTVGVTPPPAMSAKVSLCFTLTDKPGVPDSLLLPQGISVQSMPASGGLPQVFETSADLLTRPEWSAMTLWRPTPDVLASPVAPLRADAPGLLLQDGSQGIQPGATVLVRATTADNTERLELHSVTRSASANQRGCILWDAPPPQAPGTPLLQKPQAWTCRPPEALFGHDAPKWGSLSLKDQLQAGGTPVGGAQKLDLAQGVWLPQATPVSPGQKMSCLLMDDARGLFAGVEDQGLMRSQDRGATWTPVKALTRMKVLCLGRDSQGRLVVGTSRHGVLRSTDGDAWETLWGKTVQEASQPLSRTVTQDLRLPTTPVRSVVGFLVGADSNATAFLLAGTDEGLFCWEEQTGTWSPANKGLPLAGNNGRTPVSVVSILPDDKHQRFMLGTSKGVFSGPINLSPGTGKEGAPSTIATAWKSSDPASPGQAVRTLLVDEKGQVFVALEDGGLYRVADPKRLTYVEVSPRTPSGVAQVNALLPLTSGPGGPPGLLAALPEGLFLTRDGGTTWTTLPAPASLEVWAMAEPEHGTVLLFTPVTVKEKQWPNWALRPGQLDLARSVPRIAAGQQLVLEQLDDDGKTVRRELVTVTLAETGQVRDFGDRQLITRLQVTPPEAVAGFDRARAHVRSCIAPLLLLDRQIRVPRLLQPQTDLNSLLTQDDLFFALAGGAESGNPSPRESLRVAGVVADLTGRKVMVVGRRMRVWVASTSLKFVSDDGLTSQPLVRGQVLEVMGWPSASSPSPGWRLRSEHGFVGRTPATEDLLLLPSDKNGEQVALLRTVKQLVDQPGSVSLVLQEELDEMLDPDTVTVCGNVVEASHGTTLKEVLGSGDARRSQQQFRLKRSPLVWLDTADGPNPQLEVFVDEQRWHRVDDWSGQKPDSHAYQLRVDQDGTARVCFGDGIRGARLPSGAENVMALYRTGGGEAGNVEAGQIILLRQRLLGLRGVANPLPAEGGADAPAASELRVQAPLRLHTLGRIVSLRDFEQHVRAMTGVARVRSRTLWNGHAPVLSLTVASNDTGHLMSRQLEANIHQDLDRFVPPHHVLQVDSFVPRRFFLAARLTVDPDFDKDQVCQEAKGVLTDAFSFEQRELAQPVARSDLLRLLCGVRGVLNARVTALRYSDASTADTVPTVLPAADARWHAETQEVLPAELLLLEDSGPELTPEVGP
ncbi:putative baseplate assembly protein [Corallococcus sp. AB004]|nr:putative baseplate assembly protein [Corallococcus sp. AB004]